MLRNLDPFKHAGLPNSTSDFFDNQLLFTFTIKYSKIRKISDNTASGFSGGAW